MPTSTQNVLNLIAHEDYLKAQQELKQLIPQFPDQDELYNLYGYCSQRIEDICEKEDFDEPVQPLPPVDTWKEWRKIASDLADKVEYKKASNLLGLIWDSPQIVKSCFGTSYSRQPRTLLLQDRAICHFLMGEPENAKKNYLFAAKVELESLSVADPKRADYLIKIKKYEEALRLFRLAITVACSQARPRLYYHRYQLHKMLGNVKDAASDLQDALRCLELDLCCRPLFCDLYYTHAKWLIEQGDFEQALLENAKAIALWPNFYGYHVQRAEIYARLGQAAKAQEELALLDKGNLYRLESCRPAEKARVFEALGDLKKAEVLYRAENINVLARYDNLCDFYERHGRQEDIVKLREEQRKESSFRDRVSEREFWTLF